MSHRTRWRSRRKANIKLRDFRSSDGTGVRDGSCDGASCVENGRRVTGNGGPGCSVRGEGAGDGDVGV
jgi:hypothetical protein